MKIVVDMNMSAKWLDALRADGHEAWHWSEIGDPTSADDAIMEYALLRGAVVLTRDMDFVTILAANHFSKPSVVHLRDKDRFSPNVEKWVLAALRRFRPAPDEGAIASIAGPRARLRQLPVGGSQSGVQP